MEEQTAATGTQHLDETNPDERRTFAAIGQYTDAAERSVDYGRSIPLRRACRALAASLNTDDIRSSTFIVHYREPDAYSPAGTLTITHPDFSYNESVVIDSLTVHRSGENLGTHFSVFHRNGDELNPVMEEIGEVAALYKASDALADIHNENTGLLARFKQWV